MMNRSDPMSRSQSRYSAPIPISTKERFKCLDKDNIKEQPVVEDEWPDDASDPTSTLCHAASKLEVEL